MCTFFVYSYTLRNVPTLVLIAQRGEGTLLFRITYVYYYRVCYLE